MQKEHKEFKAKLKETQKELRYTKEKLKRRDKTISKLLEEIQGFVGKEQYDLLKLNFDEETLTLFENEMSQRDKHHTGFRYSENLKKFAVTLHFYSSQAYEYVRNYLHLPHVSTIRKWSASIDCKPGFLTEVIAFLNKAKDEHLHMEDCVIILDAMAIRKDIVYDPKEQKYVGFVDCGTLKAECDDTVATETLVFLVSGLTGHWKYPMAYFLDDHLTAQVQAQMIKEAIAHLSDAGYRVHATICDGSYTNQSPASLLGCSLIPGVLRYSFPHPSHPESVVYLIFYACHGIKNVRNCFADLMVLCHDGQEIRWQFIEELHKVQTMDNLFIANKLKMKHIQFHQHKMNVKLAVQTLSSSVADAIDFLREDMKLPQFDGSEKTTQFIRIMDQLFDMLNCKSPVGKGLKEPITLANFEMKKSWMMKTMEYIKNLTDIHGKKLTSGRRKTPWVGFLCSIQSTIDLCHHLLFRLDSPFKYVLTYKLSQDHLEMLFSRIRRHGGWNNNPNCLQLKYALRAILMKNGITPSRNANCVDITVEEPANVMFQHVPSQAAINSQAQMQEFASLLRKPTIWHDQVLNYLAGYIARHVVKVKNSVIKINILTCVKS